MRKNRPNKEKMKCVVGRVFYLPLPLEETVKKICKEQDPINLNPEFYILVRGVPNKNKHIWENVVNMNKVFNGLNWLKDHNHLYSKIILPKSSNDLTNILNDIPDIEHQQNIATNSHELD